MIGTVALYRFYFAIPSKQPSPPLVRLYVTSEDLRTASGHRSTPAEARTAFIHSIKQAVGPRSLGFDAKRRRNQWDPESDSIPPFLSHLLLTCMVANDLAEDLRWTGNFRERIAHILGPGAERKLERLRPLWEDLADWTARQNLAGEGCRRLKLPEIPDSGYHSIIGYSIKLAVPSRRDQTILAALFGQHDLAGREPEVDVVLRVVSSNIGRFSSDFEQAFRDFVTARKSQPLSVLFHTTLWTAVREVAFSTLTKRIRERSPTRVRLELEDDDGRFWLVVTSDTELGSSEVASARLPNPRQSDFQFRLTDSVGNNLAGVLFSGDRFPLIKSGKLFHGIRSSISEGILLFEESDDYVFVLSLALPSSGKVRALVSDKLKAAFKQAVESVGTRPEITRAEYVGWSEWRGLNVEGLQRLKLARFPSLANISALRVTIPPPEIKLRDGIRVGNSFVALEDALPHVDIEGADRVTIEIASGDWETLEKHSVTDLWLVPASLPTARLLGTHRILAFASSVAIAERNIDFVESVFTSDYKQPLDSSRWLVEAATIDLIPFSDNPACTGVIEPNRSLMRTPPVVKTHAPDLKAPAKCSLTTLTTLLCARLTAQRGMSEGELVPVMAGQLGVKVSDMWPILRGWVEAGTLEVLTDPRWRARLYFGRRPQLVVRGHHGHYEAVLVGLVPPHLLERFDTLSSGLNLTNVARRSVSEFVPALPRCRSARLSHLEELAKQLTVHPLVQIRPPADLLCDVRTSVERHSSTTHDSWPVFRHWDWKRRFFAENSFQITSAGISVQWCRRDDGPDRYKLYRDGSFLWWTRSRTWAMLAAYTLAGVPVFDRKSGTMMESQGDSLYLPLPAARLVSWTAPMNAGPVRLPDGKTAYRYSFPDETARESVLAKLWPEESGHASVSSEAARQLAVILRTGHGPVTPIPESLRRSLGELLKGRYLPLPAFVPASALPHLYSILKTVRKGES
jgi:hypothetical protein